MRYSVETSDRLYVTAYGFLSFAKNTGQTFSSEYGQKLLDNAKKSTTDAIKTASKRAIQKPAEATGDLTGNKAADKMTSISKKCSAELHSKTNSANNETEIPKKRYKSPAKRQ